MLSLLLLLAISAQTPNSSLQDDGFGVCPAFTHYHKNWNDMSKEEQQKFKEDEKGFDGKCHYDDDTDKPIEERPKLPKPNKRPGQISS